MKKPLPGLGDLEGLIAMQNAPMGKSVGALPLLLLLNDASLFAFCLTVSAVAREGEAGGKGCLVHGLSFFEAQDERQYGHAQRAQPQPENHPICRRAGS